MAVTGSYHIHFSDDILYNILPNFEYLASRMHLRIYFLSTRWIRLRKKQIKLQT